MIFGSLQYINVQEATYYSASFVMNAYENTSRTTSYLRPEEPQVSYTPEFSTSYE